MNYTNLNRSQWRNEWRNGILLLHLLFCSIVFINMKDCIMDHCRDRQYTSKASSSWVCTSENQCFPFPLLLSIFPKGLLSLALRWWECVLDRKDRETAYMPVARHFQANITKQTQTNKLSSLSASLSLPSAQTALPSLSGLPDMLIAL